MEKLIFVLLFTFCVSIACSQSCCSGGTPLASNLGVRPIDAKSLHIQLTYDYNTQKDQISGTERLKDRNRERNTHSWLLQLKYGINSRSSLIGLFSYLVQEEINTTPGNPRQFVDAQGFGDFIGMYQYLLLDKPDFQMLGALGLKIPVGPTEIRNPQTNIVLPSDMQPSSASWDGVGAIQLIKTKFIRPTMALNFGTTYRLTTPAKRFNNTLKYKFGNELQITAGISDQFLIVNWIVNPTLMFRYRRTAEDLQSRINDIDVVDVPVVNTGGQWIYLVPSFQIEFTPRWSWSAYAELPVYRNLEGVIQLTTTFKLGTSVLYLIAW